MTCLIAKMVHCHHLSSCMTMCNSCQQPSTISVSAAPGMVVRARRRVAVTRVGPAGTRPSSTMATMACRNVTAASSMTGSAPPLLLLAVARSARAPRRRHDGPHHAGRLGPRWRQGLGGRRLRQDDDAGRRPGDAERHLGHAVRLRHGRRLGVHATREAHDEADRRLARADRVGHDRGRLDLLPHRRLPDRPVGPAAHHPGGLGGVHRGLAGDGLRRRQGDPARRAHHRGCRRRPGQHEHARVHRRVHDAALARRARDALHAGLYDGPVRRRHRQRPLLRGARRLEVDAGAGDGAVAGAAGGLPLPAREPALAGGARPHGRGRGGAAAPARRRGLGGRRAQGHPAGLRGRASQAGRGRPGPGEWLAARDEDQTRSARPLPGLRPASLPAAVRHQHRHVLQRHHHQDGRRGRQLDSHLAGGGRRGRQLRVHARGHPAGGQAGPAAASARLALHIRTVADHLGQRLPAHGPERPSRDRRRSLRPVRRTADLLGLHQRPPHVRLLPPGQRLGVVLAPGRRTGHGAGRRLRAALCADLAGRRVGRRLLPLGLLVDRRGRPSRLPLLLCTWHGSSPMGDEFRDPPSVGPRLEFQYCHFMHVVIQPPRVTDIPHPC